MKKAIILEGWYQKPDSNWYPWLKNQLEDKGYEVSIPDLPTIRTKQPSQKKQLEFLSKHYEINNETSLIQSWLSFSYASC